MNNFIEIDLLQQDKHARLWKGPYGWQIYPAGEMNQIMHTKHYGFYCDHNKILEMVDILKSRAKNKPLFIDCGANIGNISMGVRHFMGEGVEIHAFEAQKTIAQMMTGSIALMSWGNVIVHNVAVTDGNITEIEVPRYNYSLYGQYGSVELGKEAPFKNTDMTIGIQHQMLSYDIVKGRSIDSYEFPEVDLLKIDIEGMEIQALRGARDTIQRCRPIMIMEHFKSNQEELKNFLDEANYSIVKEDNMDYVCVPKT
jgi:hypothetical protein